MSHEIRTPLNGILGFADILRRADRDLSEAERGDYLSTICSSGQHLLTIINDILDLSKIEAGMMAIERAPCSPHQIIADVISVLRVRAHEKGLLLEYRWIGGIPETIHTDAIRLRQLLMNLIGNAIKFTEVGGVKITATLDQTACPQLVIDVSDTGIGIPAEKLGAIFSPFVQVDTSVTRRYGGTGLGLAISDRLAHALGGGLRVRSDLGRGSVFTATVATGPLERVRIVAPSAAMTTSGDVSRRCEVPLSLSHARILLAEDGDTNRKLINLILTRAGATVTTVENGQMALEIATQKPFDLILMDMQMPVMDGYTATSALRATGFDGPIIALTAHAMKGDEQKCLTAGCTAYLAKPIDSNKLIRTVASRLGRSLPQGAGDPFAADRPLGSTLPMDDPDFHALAKEFADCLPPKIAALREACRTRDLQEVGRLAHWLKGVAGSVGFAAFTVPAADLEQLARSGIADGLDDLVGKIEELAHRVDVPCLRALAKTP